MKALTWLEVANLLATKPLGSTLRLRRPLTQHPKDGGLVPTLGFPVGQRADYRVDYGGPHILHVQDFGTHLEARLEPRQAPRLPAVPSSEVASDVAGALLGGAALGGLVGLLFGRTSNSAFAGVILGGALGAVAASAAEQSKGALSETGNSSGTTQVVRKNLTTKSHP